MRGEGKTLSISLYQGLGLDTISLHREHSLVGAQTTMDMSGLEPPLVATFCISSGKELSGHRKIWAKVRRVKEKPFVFGVLLTIPRKGNLLISRGNIQ